MKTAKEKHLQKSRIRDMKPYREVFSSKTENMWIINNNISENFQYSLCRLAGNQSAVDLTNLHIIWRGRSSPISGVSSSGKT